MDVIFAVNQTTSPILWCSFFENKYIQFKPNVPVTLSKHQWIQVVKKHRNKIVAVSEEEAQSAAIKYSILVKRDFGIGDVLLLEPALRQLDNQGKSVFVHTNFPQVFENNPHIKHCYHKKENVPRNKFDVCEVLDGKSEAGPHTWTLNRSEIYAKLLNVECEDLTPRIYISELEKKTRVLQKKKGNTYVAIQLDSSHPARKYTRGKELCDKLVEAGYTPVLLGRTHHVKPQNKKVINLQLKTSVREAFHVVREADFFIGVDSGLLHIAGAVETPAVALFSYIKPELRIKHYKGQIECVQTCEKMGCGNGDMAKGICKDNRKCMNVAPELVIESLQKLQKTSKRRVYINKPDIKATTKNCIYVINHKNKKNKKTNYYDMSLETIKRYAQKIGVDLVVSKEQKINLQPYTPHYEKFYMKELLNVYERVLYLDLDIIVKKDAPDLFEKYKDRKKVYMLSEVEKNGLNLNQWIRAGVKRADGDVNYEKWYRLPNGNFQYFNSGVMLLSRPNAKYVNTYRFFKHPNDQTFINWMFMREGVKMESIDLEDNAMIDYNNEGNFLHFTGTRPGVDYNEILKECYERNK